MPQYPSGTVTFLFTDIEGSTRLWERYPEAMKVAVAQHDAILKDAVEGHAGYLVKTTGDGIFAAFGLADDALAAALNAQRALSSVAWSETGPLRVRMGLHTGPAQERDGDYFGPALNRAARLMAVGHGGQVLLTMPTYELVRDHAPKGVALRDLGEGRLKDLARPEHIYQVVAPDLPADFPPLKTLDVRPNNLPVQRDPLIGREKEIAAVRDLLMRPRVGLVTLTGPGGTGKTRLALQVGADLLDEFKDGVFFVNLAPITDTALVATTIAQTLDLREQGGRSNLDLLKDYLHEKSLLLLLDNFEQITSAAPLVSDLLAAAPRLKVIVTSREILRLRDEREFAVPPLATPNPKRLPATRAELVEALSQFDAVRLFIERASAVKPDFAVTNDNAPAIAEICYRLDGLPLAIELAAARIKLFPPQGLLQRLGASLKVLTGGARDLPTRQQTLRDAIAWSYDLLPEHEQRLFRRLGIFVGGFTLEAAEAVCGPDGERETDVVEGVGSLVDKSLVQQREGVESEPRFTMLETIREFARERLAAQGEEVELRRRHVAYFLALAEDGERGLQGPDLREWMGRLAADLDNLRAALESSAGDAESQELALRIASALFRFWFYQGLASEGRRWLEDLLYRPGERGALWGRRCYQLSHLLSFEGNVTLTHARAVDAVDACRAVGDEIGLAYSLIVLGGAIGIADDPSSGISLLEQGLDLFRTRAPNDAWGLLWAMWVHASVLTAQGHVAAARREFEDALAIARSVRNPYLIAQSLDYLGDTARAEGDYTQARTYYIESVALFRQAGIKSEIPALLHNMGYVELGQGAPEGAAALFREALHVQRELGNRAGIAECLEGLAAVAAAQGDGPRGARLSGAAEALREAVGAIIWPGNRLAYEHHLAILRTELDETALKAVWAEGRAMTLDEAVAYAIEGLLKPQ